MTWGSYKKALNGENKQKYRKWLGGSLQYSLLKELSSRKTKGLGCT